MQKIIFFNGTASRNVENNLGVNLKTTKIEGNDIPLHQKLKQIKNDLRQQLERGKLRRYSKATKKKKT